MKDQERLIEERPEWLWQEPINPYEVPWQDVRTYIEQIERKNKRLVAAVLFTQESLDARESYISELEKERNYWMDRAEANSKNVR